MVRIGTLLMPVLYLSVILGSAVVLTASATVTGSMLQSIGADRGRVSDVRPPATISLPAPPANKVPVPLMPLPAPQEASLATLAPSPAAAAELSTATDPLFSVTTAINVRAGASKASDLLATLAAGETVSIVEREGHWVRIARDGVELGWVYDRYLSELH